MQLNNSGSFAASIDNSVISTYVQKVYAWMVGGLMLTAGMAWVVSGSETLMNTIFGSPLAWVVMLAPLGMVFFLSSRIDHIKPSTAAASFLAFAVLMGISLASIFWKYQLGSIFQVFLIASGMYAGAAIYGYTTKRDLTGFGSFLFMGLIGLIIASVVNIFLGSSVLEFAVSIIGVFIFTGLTAYDMSKIKDQAVVMFAGEGLATKRAIIGALSLYLNFLNLFLFLLRLLGNRN